MSQLVHIPVLTTQVLTFLLASEGGRFLDCTLGGGGHSLALIQANPINTILSIDRDEEALIRTDPIFADCSRIERKHGRFSDLSLITRGQKFKGVLADLGCSTQQLKGGRGFSFSDQGSLDMRMDQSNPKSAAKIVNQSTEKELFIILKRGGVGNEAKKIARAIVDNRPIETPKQLAAVISGASKAGSTSAAATVPFQAIRMEVNDEIAEIESLLEIIPKIVESRGRAAIITFHSIEDKVVTSRMREWASGGTAPASWGGSQEKVLGKLLTKKPIVPEEQEIEANPSARSARLRVFEFH